MRKTTKKKIAPIVIAALVIVYIIPLMGMVLGAMGLTGIWLERLTKLGGMGLYTVLNYFGQRFFAFQKKS